MPEQPDPLKILEQLRKDSKEHNAETLLLVDDLAKAFFAVTEKLEDIIARQNLAIVQKDITIERLEAGLVVPSCPIKKKAN